MLDTLLAVSPRDNDSLTLRRGHALALLMLLFIAVVGALGCLDLIMHDLPALNNSLVGLALFTLVYALNRNGYVRFAVLLLLCGGALLAVNAAVVVGSPVPTVYFLSLTIIVAAAFGPPSTPLLWAMVLSSVPFGINLLLYHSPLASTALIPLPNGATMPSLFAQELFAIALYWMLAGTAYFSSRLLKQLLDESRAATERKRAEAALRQSEARFAKVFHISPVAISISRLADNYFIDVNDSFLQLMGYGRDEVADHTAIELNLWGQPGDHAQIAEIARRQGSIRDLESSFRTRSGEVRDGLSSIDLIELDGETCLLSTLIDITERKRAEAALRDSEERYRLIAEHSRDLIMLLDSEGRVLYASPSHQRVLGYAPIELIGQEALNLVHPDDRDVIAREWAKLATEDHIQATVRARHANGDWLWIEISSSMLDQSSSLNVSRDITERKRLEAQLLQAQKMEMIGRLAGGVAHDFNNLLTAITGYADLAIEELAPANPVRGDIQELRRAADRATSLTHQLLTFARKQRIEPRVVDLNQLIRDMQEFIRRLIGEHIELITLPAPDLGSVQADINQIEQVIINLVVNARDAMPQGGRLVIETSNVVLDAQQIARRIDVLAGHYVLLTVSDTGVGMDAAVKEHLFEPFFTTKAPGKGTGLGLATCYGIVRQHGGIILPYSEPGHGTIMNIYLPRVDAPADPRLEAAARTTPRGDETILLVEDEPAVRALVARVLRAQGYTVLEAGDGLEALQVAEQAEDTRIDLLLTDVVMPRMGGSALAEQLSAIRPGIKVLFASGYTEDVMRLGSQLVGSTQFLHKPFSPAALAQKVRSILDT
ncbi:MAG TPA: PAS domain S-box protein [Roseiflexaceae bacterium]|nr:PAS domain S-box protein [Roseiflexaceae bacterium]